jgi:cytochrome oxidase assembly protein ShyY1
MPIIFRFRWVPFVAAATVIAVGVSLGHWQTQRAAEKVVIGAKMSARQSAPPVALDAGEASDDFLEYRRAIVHGEFVRDWAIYLDNRPYRGVAGFYMLMPLKVAGSSRYVLVVRGWLPRDPVDRTRLQNTPTPEGIVEIEGLLVRNPGQLMQLGSPQVPQPDAILQNIDVAAFTAASKLPMQSLMLEQLNDTHDGLVRDWPRPGFGIDRHRGYAFQWYALAATAFVFFLVTGFRRGIDQAER